MHRLAHRDRDLGRLAGLHDQPLGFLAAQGRALSSGRTPARARTSPPRWPGSKTAPGRRRRPRPSPARPIRRSPRPATSRGPSRPGSAPCRARPVDPRFDRSARASGSSSCSSDLSSLNLPCWNLESLTSARRTPPPRRVPRPETRVRNPRSRPGRRHRRSRRAARLSGSGIGTSPARVGTTRAPAAGFRSGVRTVNSAVPGRAERDPARAGRRPGRCGASGGRRRGPRDP